LSTVRRYPELAFPQKFAGKSSTIVTSQSWPPRLDGK